MSVKDHMARAVAAMTMLDAKWFSASTPNDWGGGGNLGLYQATGVQSACIA